MPIGEQADGGTATPVGTERDSDATKLARVASFLRDHDLSLDDILEAVDERPGEECLLFVGSVPAGTSTRFSDADLIAIGATPGPAALNVQQNGVAQLVRTLGEHLEVCTAYYAPPVLQMLAERTRRALFAIGHPRPADEPLDEMETLDISVLKFAHRIRSGVPLRGSVQPLREAMVLQHLDDYLVTHGILEQMIYLEDVRGELDSGSAASAAYTFTYSMNFLAGAMLAAVGETNPDPKWRVRLLQRERDRIGGERADELCRYLLGPGDQEPVQWIRNGFRFSADVAEHCLASRPLARQAVAKVRKAVTLAIDPP